MTPLLDHLHVTVRDLKRAECFYDQFLPLLGFDLHYKEYDCKEANAYEIIEYHHAAFSIGIVSPRSCFEKEKLSRRKPGALHHVAFMVEDTQTADCLYEQVMQMKMQIVHAPRYYPEYCEDYYAFFLKDSEGIELEITSYDCGNTFLKSAVIPKIANMVAEANGSGNAKAFSGLLQHRDFQNEKCKGIL